MRPWLIELETCPSTSTWALEHCAALAHGACVWTQRQTAGRGRGGSSWKAPAGVLTASFVLHLKTATPQLSLAAGLAVCHAIEDLCPGMHVGLKWPNDLWLVKDKTEHKFKTTCSYYRLIIDGLDLIEFDFIRQLGFFDDRANIDQVKLPSTVVRRVDCDL